MAEWIAVHLAQIMEPLSSYWIVAAFMAGALCCVPTTPSVSEDAGAEPGTTFRDCPVCPEMVVVPEGSFMMGSNKGDFDEKPVHAVTITEPFAVGKYEVMWDEWEVCVAEAMCDNGPVNEAGGDNGWGKGRRPVIEVSWHDAQIFVAWLNTKVPGEPYRLLSEAEWEYAARAGATTQFSWGDDFDSSKANDGNKLVPVGQYSPNGLGLYDMHGNALEWVRDCYRDSYSDAPTDGSSVSETSDCLRVLRSGAWSYGPRVLRSSDRYEMPPGDRINILGFRIARTL